MDFLWEYLRESDRVVNNIIFRSENMDKNIFYIGDVFYRKAFANYIWELIFFGEFKNTFCKMKSKNEDVNGFLKQIEEKFISKIIVSDRNSFLIEKFKSKLENVLIDRREKKIFYSKNNRQLRYLLPILEKENEPSIVLSMEELDVNLDNPNVEIIEFNLIDTEFSISETFLEKNFFIFFLHLNTFYILIKILRPKLFFLLEGCHYEEEIISSICKKFEIKTYCIQQGWPSLMHTRFKNMTYDYFLTWGDGFNELWKKDNPIPSFKSLGYLYKSTNFEDEKIEKQAITFFFQAPIFTISMDCFNGMIDFVIFCAKAFPNRPILIREHPEFPIFEYYSNNFKNYKNIIFVTEDNLESIFLKTEIGISIFSSTLVEGLIYNVIPFIFNLTSSPSYYPNLDEMGVGVEVKSMEEAKERITSLSEDSKKILIENIHHFKQKYFLTNVDFCLFDT